MATIGTTYGADLGRPGYPNEGGQAGIREDLSDIITDISPTETPFFTKCAKQKVKNTFTEWQTNELRDAAVTGHVEGADTTTSFNPTVRVGNYTAIGKSGFSVSGTADAVDTAGRAREYAYQALQAGKALKRDLEMTLLGTQSRDPGSTSTPRMMAGVGGWISSNTVGDAAFPSDPDGTGGFVAGSGAPFNQEDFDELLQSLWLNGGEPDRVYLASDLMAAAVDALVGNNNQRGEISASEQKVVNSMIRYQTPWGVVTFVPDRFMPAGSIYVLDSKQWRVGTLRGWRQTELARTGDSKSGQIIGEHTLISLNEKASGHMASYTPA